MKLCVQAQQEKKYLDWAQEIIFHWKDRKIIKDYIQLYPDKKMVLECYEPISKIDWNELNAINALTNENLILKIKNISIANQCILNNIKFFFAYGIKSYDELNTVLNLNPYYIRLGAPLFFELDHIQKFYSDIKIRLVPNIAYDDLYSHENGIVGTWIRPEDIMMYDDYAEIIEFENVDDAQERALIRIYWTERQWLGDIDLIISDFNHIGSNPLLTSEFTEKRLNCGQTCMKNHNCKICYRHVNLANLEQLIDYQEAISSKYKVPENNN